MTAKIKRRAFITLLGGAAASLPPLWPLAVHAQKPERMRRIGVLMPYAADDAETQTRMGAFLQALALSGWTIGRNLQIDIRWAAFDPERMRKQQNWPRSRPTSFWLMPMPPSGRCSR